MITKMKVAMFVGAGFAKAWGLPLANEIMDMQDIHTKYFPGKWQVELIEKVEAVWNATHPMHKGIVDEFARMLQQSKSFKVVIERHVETKTCLDDNWSSKLLHLESEVFTTRHELSFEEFTSFLALRLSSKHWQVGTARETKWGTGDHIRKQQSVPKGYQELHKALKKVDLIGIVTTNYDLVIEKLLGPTSSGRLGGFNYGKGGERLLGRHPVSSQWTYGPVTITGKIPLLKLNGSLNWAISSDGQVVKYIDSRPSRSRRYQVLLLPPATGIKHNKLQPIWEHAERVLRTADVWIFCGYSVPDYDQAVRDLLRTSVKNTKRIVILDINAGPIKQKLYDLLSNSNSSIDICVGPGITSQLNARNITSLF